MPAAVVPAYLQGGNRFDGYDDCLSSEVSIKKMSVWFEKMTAREYRKGTVIPEFRAVRRVVTDCLRLLTGFDDASIAYDGGFVVSYTASDGTYMEDQPFETLSDGYRVVIGLVADIARRMAQLNPFLAEQAVARTPGVVLIDEVDLHLHPKWQGKILGVLHELFPLVQFIVTTHAPMVISSVQSKNLRVIEPVDGGDGKYVAVSPDDETYGVNAGAILREVMGTPDKPAAVQDKLDEFGQYLNDKEYGKAQATLRALQNEVGEDNPDLSNAWAAYYFAVPAPDA